MAAKKRRKKASKKVSKKKTVKRRKKAVSKSTTGELSLLHKIDKKVTRIDRSVNAGFHLARKARKAKRRKGVEEAWEDVERHGME